MTDEELQRMSWRELWEKRFDMPLSTPREVLDRMDAVLRTKDPRVN